MRRNGGCQSACPSTGQSPPLRAIAGGRHLMGNAIRRSVNLRLRLHSVGCMKAGARSTSTQIGVDRNVTKTLRDVHLRSWYSSGRSDLLRDFYIPCLEAATLYDRAAGYFRSSIFVVAGLAFVDFVERGGRVRLICSPDLSEQDMEAIRRGDDASRQIDEALIRELRALAQESGNEVGLRFLATLLSSGALEIKIAYRPGSPGIFHDKIGVFASADDSAVAFMGSSNESRAAILREWNHESFAAFTSWQGATDAERVTELASYFTELWTKGEPGLEVRRLRDVPREEIDKHRHPEGLELAAEGVRSALSGNRPTVRERGWEPRPLLNHQTSVVRDWEEKGFRGIVKHATGAGKTLTAIEAIRRWITRGRSAVVLVPSDLLLTQWATEIERELGDLRPDRLYVGGTRSSSNWQDDLADFTREATFLGPRVVLATMQTAATDRFLRRVVEGDHLLVVADEVHRMGSRQNRLILAMRAGARLGLSATPERFGDAEGTLAIFDYFGSVLSPEFGIPDAIKSGHLVPYEYHVHVVALTKQEQERWDQITERIKAAYGRLPDDDSGGKRVTDEYKMLLIRRASILKRAERKADLAAETLRQEFVKGDRWLVYCDNADQLRKVLDQIRGLGMDAHEYRSEMSGSRSATLDYFERVGGILVAIKCLDEGVDIPAVNRALILASSSNPREFIQRRGRVLRRSPGKYSAVVHDALVVPSGSSDEEIDTKPILRVEIARAAEFARYAQNRAVSHHLRELANRFDVQSVLDRAGDHEEDEQ